MLRKSIYAAMLTALIGACLYAIATPAPAAVAPVRIMALGDSITGSPGCWRALLWRKLIDAGHSSATIDFVGTLPPQGCGFSYDGENEGHGGILATGMADQNQLPPWLAATKPDVVLMHLGTNDVWSNRSTTTILNAFSKLVDQMRAANPDMKILVAQIIPMNPGSCPECAARVVALNEAIPGWAASKSTAASPITVVDQWTGFDTATDTGDGVHPNAAGDQKIADAWFPALTAVLSGAPVTPSPVSSPSPGPVSSPSPSPSPSRVPTPSPTPIPDAYGCTATYKITNQWQGGFQGEITVKNVSAVSGLTTWKVSWTFTAGQQITQAWNGTASQSGAAVTVTNAAWNGDLPPGGTAQAGFIASWNGANPVPAVTCSPA